MTIHASDVVANFKHLKQIINDPAISDLEASLLVEVAIQIHSGNRTKHALMGVFEATKSRRPEDLDSLKLLRACAES
jgi:hypothetical protein